MWVFLLISQAFSYCITQKYYSECDNSHLHDVIISGTGDCTESYPKILKSLPCDKSCPPGTYLEIIDSTLDCKHCPSGTFSVGGGFNYGREGTKWSSALKTLINDCWMRQNKTDYHNFDCSPWKDVGGVLETSEISEPNLYTASLTFSLKVVKTGKFSIKYRKDTYRVNGHKIGTFVVTKNNENILSDNEIDQSNWKSFQVDLQIGLNEIVIDYLTKHVDGTSYPKAYIASVEVVGTKFADTECYPCLMGGNTIGSSTCEVCDFNEYYNNGVCEDCPADTYSLKGANSIYSCLKREPCQSSDYKPIYSECKKGVRELYFVWKEPLFCDFANSKLPASQTNLPCEPCKPGYMNETTALGISTCVPCQAGEYFDTISGVCKVCTPGKYARRQLNITDWTDLPDHFETSCKTYSGSPCLHSNGWIPSTHYITTGLGIHNDSEIFLSRYVNIQSSTGFIKVSYQFTTRGSGFLDIYVDGAYIETWTGHEKNYSYVKLNEGEHFVQWVYWAYGAIKEEVQIYSMKIHGSDEGSALRCISCEVGFISTGSQPDCIACLPGTSSDFENKVCLKCPVNTYSNAKGSKCIKCPTGTKPNLDQSNCIADEYAYFNMSTYYLRNISGLGNLEGSYSGGVCNMPTAQLYCHQTFYGPLPGTNKDFYISILNPTYLNLPNANYYYLNQSAFAFAVVDKSLITGFKADQDSCLQEKIILNLGTVVTGMNTIPGGYRINYGHGDTCISPPFYYNSTISVICDKKTGTGWPVYVSESKCTYNFKWASKYGCRQCLKSEMKSVKSDCSNGVRTYKLVELENCIASNLDTQEYTESCSELDEVINSWPMLIGIILLAILLTLSFISMLIYCKYKRRYEKLTESTRNI